MARHLPRVDVESSFYTYTFETNIHLYGVSMGVCGPRRLDDVQVQNESVTSQLILGLLSERISKI